MPPSMDEVLSPPHPCNVPSPVGPSSEEPASDMDEVHNEVYMEDPSPAVLH